MVIAIIAVLASLLLPALRKAKSSGKRAACASTLRQVGHALRMYAMDYQDYLPSKDLAFTAGLDRSLLISNWSLGGHGLGRFRDIVRLGYVTQNVLYCPGQRLPARWYPGYLINNDPGHLIESHHYGGTGDWIYFGGGTMFYNYGSGQWTELMLKLADVNESRWPLVMDRIGTPGYCYYEDGGTNHDPKFCAGGNVVYADGHVEWVPIGKTVPSTSFTTTCHIPVDESGRGIPHYTHGSIGAWYDTFPTIVSPSQIIARGYLYRVPGY